MLGFGVLYASAMINVLMHPANKLVGFHPVLALVIPVWGFVGVISLVLFATRYRLLALSGIASCGLISVVFFSGRQIVLFSNDYHLWQYSESNMPALESLKSLPEGSPDDFFNNLYSESNLVTIAGFKWYDEIPFPALGKTEPTPVFLGANILGYPHVRVEKVRHGWQGFAMIPNEQTNIVEQLKRWATYRKTRINNIWQWSTGG